MSKRLDYHPNHAGHHGKSTRSLGDLFRGSRLRRAAQEAMGHAYVSLIAAGVSTRRAAVLTAMGLSTATRRLPRHRTHARGVGANSARPGQAAD